MLPYTEKYLLPYVMGYGFTILMSAGIVLWRPLYTYFIMAISIISPVITFVIFKIHDISRENLITSIFYSLTLVIFTIIMSILRYSSAKKEYIARAKLEEARKELEKLYNMKNEFISNITHDFRSPLMIIYNLSGIWKKKELKKEMDFVDKEQTEVFKTIYLSAVQLKKSIDTLLDISKMDARRAKLNIVKLPIVEYIRNLHEFYNSGLYLRNTRVILEVPDKEINDFYTDKEKLEAILNNIISNAIKFSDEENGIITIKVKNLNNFVQISIKDNGIGISAENKERLFKRFEQLNKSRNFSYKGTGIGLAYAKQLTDLLIGKIWAKSEGEGKGTEFFLEFSKGYKHFTFSEDNSFNINEDLPSIYNIEEIDDLILSELKKTKKKNLEIHFEDIENKEFDLKKAKILLVDDNVDILEIEKTILKNEGYKNFILAYNGIQALEAIYEYKPDIIISDYNMPEITGDVVHDEIAANENFRNIPFIFVSAIADENIIINRKRKGAMAYLKKPLNEEEFTLNVEIFLKKHMEYLKTFKEANIDGLTQLSNRRRTFEILNKLILKNKGEDLTIVFFDVDNFKQINDLYGHDVGDKVLVAIGKALNTNLRGEDIAGRFGGDEFIVALPNSNIREAIALLEKVRKSFKISVEKNKTIIFKCSFGISSLKENENYICNELKLKTLKEIFDGDGLNNISIEKNIELKENILKLLFSMADKALYMAKETECINCNYKFENRYTSGICPKCGSNNIKVGKNKIVQFK
jgi:diguanylate cyclase (GGDEF)-like protein